MFNTPLKKINKIYNKNIWNVPLNLNLIVLKNNKKMSLVVYTNEKKASLNFNINKKIKLDKNTNSIVVERDNGVINNMELCFFKKLNKIFQNFEKFFWKKIKFKGKGFRVRFKKKNKMLRMMFGHSHINIVFINNETLKMKRLGKYKYFLKSNDQQKLNRIAKKICKVKPINMYTKRGIRLGKQIIFKRKGKKSTYV